MTCGAVATDWRTNASPDKASARLCVYNLVASVALVVFNDVGIGIAYAEVDVETMIVQIDTCKDRFVSAPMGISRYYRLRSVKTTSVN